MSIIAGARGRGAATATYEYDFATHGGTQAAKTLTALADKLPDNAVIVGCHLEGITLPVSGGAATIKVGYTGNDDAFIPATAYNNGEFAADAVTVAGAELPVKLTAAVDVLATIATANLTAGKFRVHVDYIEGV